MPVLAPPPPVRSRVSAPEPSAEPASRPAPFYGWTMLPLAMLVLIASSPGQTFGFAFFNPHFQSALSLSSTQLSTAYLVATLLAAIPLSYVGALTDRFGLRASLLATVSAMAAGCVLLASTTNVAMLGLSFFLMRLLGPGLMVLLANNTLAAWFDRRLGFASGAMQLSMAAAFALVPASMLRLIDAFGWRNAYLIIGLGMVGLLLPLFWRLYRENPADLNQFPDGRRHEEFGESPGPQVLPGVALVSGEEQAEALPSTARLQTPTSFMLSEATHTPAYWILIAATASWAMIGTGLVFHMEALFTACGLSRSTMEWAPTMLAIGMATMQLGGGLLADRIAIRWLVMLAAGGMAVSCLCIAGASVSAALLAAFTIYGLSQGLMSIIAGTAWARFFGRAHLGKIRGTALTAAVAASSVGPLVMGISADYLGGFTPSLLLFAAIAGSVSIAGCFAATPSRPTR